MKRNYFSCILLIKFCILWKFLLVNILVDSFEPSIMLFIGIQIMPTKRNKKLIVKNAIKFVSFIFPEATNKTLSICFKRLIRKKKMKNLNNVPIFQQHLWTTMATMRTAINVLLKLWIGSRKLNKHLHLEWIEDP